MKRFIEWTVSRVHQELPLCDFAYEPLAVLAKPHNRGSEACPLRIDDDVWFSPFNHQATELVVPRSIPITLAMKSSSLPVAASLREGALSLASHEYHRGESLTSGGPAAPAASRLREPIHQAPFGLRRSLPLRQGIVDRVT